MGQLLQISQYDHSESSLYASLVIVDYAKMRSIGSSRPCRSQSSRRRKIRPAPVDIEERMAKDTGQRRFEASLRALKKSS
jgi:hypothetical protein